jgi:hypothetical protein
MGGGGAGRCLCLSQWDLHREWEARFTRYEVNWFIKGVRVVCVHHQVGERQLHQVVCGEVWGSPRVGGSVHQVEGKLVHRGGGGGWGY